MDTVTCFDFIFLPTESDHVSTIDVMLVDTKTRQLTSQYQLDYPRELTQWTHRSYPYLNAASLIYANHVHVWIWLLEYQMNDCAVSIEQRKHLLYTCLKTLMIALKFKISDFFHFHVQDGELLKSHDNINHLLKRLLGYPMDSSLKHFLSLQIYDYLQGWIAFISFEECYEQQTLTVIDYTKRRLAHSPCEILWALMLLDESSHTIDCLISFLQREQGLAARYYGNVNGSFCKDILSIFNNATMTFNYNIVCSLMKEHDLDQKVAMDETVDICNTAYLSLQPMANNTLEQNYIDKLKLWCRANLQWHLTHSNNLSNVNKK